LLAVVFAPIHVAGAALYLTDILGLICNGEAAPGYDVNKAVELAALLYLSTLRLPS
jgi:acetamidase/formamidase